MSFQLERKPDSRKQKKGEPAGIMNIFWKLTAADRPFFPVGPFYQEWPQSFSVPFVLTKWSPPTGDLWINRIGTEMTAQTPRWKSHRPVSFTIRLKSFSLTCEIECACYTSVWNAMKLVSDPSRRVAEIRWPLDSLVRPPDYFGTSCRSWNTLILNKGGLAYGTT